MVIHTDFQHLKQYASYTGLNILWEKLKFSIQIKYKMKAEHIFYGAKQNINNSDKTLGFEILHPPEQLQNGYLAQH